MTSFWDIASTWNSQRQILFFFSVRCVGHWADWLEWEIWRISYAQVCARVLGSWQIIGGYFACLLTFTLKIIPVEPLIVINEFKVHKLKSVLICYLYSQCQITYLSSELPFKKLGKLHTHKIKWHRFLLHAHDEGGKENICHIFSC